MIDTLDELLKRSFDKQTNLSRQYERISFVYYLSPTQANWDALVKIKKENEKAWAEYCNFLKMSKNTCLQK